MEPTRPNGLFLREFHRDHLNLPVPLDQNPVQWSEAFFHHLDGRRILVHQTRLSPERESCLAHLRDQLQEPRPLPTAETLNQLLDRSADIQEYLPAILALLNTAT